MPLVLPLKVKRFWFSVNTVYPHSSRCSRLSLIPAVCINCQPTGSKAPGSFSQLYPSCWDRKQAAHSQEFSPARSLVSQVAQM